MAAQFWKTYIQSLPYTLGMTSKHWTSSLPDNIFPPLGHHSETFLVHLSFFADYLPLFNYSDNLSLARYRYSTHITWVYVQTLYIRKKKMQVVSLYLVYICRYITTLILSWALLRFPQTNTWIYIYIFLFNIYSIVNRNCSDQTEHSNWFQY